MTNKKMFDYLMWSVIGLCFSFLITLGMFIGYRYALRTIVNEKHFQVDGINYHVIPSSYL